MAANNPTPKADESRTLATVTSCRRTWATWFVNEATPDEAGTYSLAEFLVSFSCTVQGKQVQGRIQTGAPYAPGDTFEINLDTLAHTVPSGKLRPALRRLLLWGLAAGTLALLARLTPALNW